MGLSGRSYSIQPISGNLNFSQARHLLDRSLFGATKGEVDNLVGKNISFAISILMQAPKSVATPISIDAKDLEVTLGATWINTPYNGTYNTYRLRSLYSWWIGNMVQQNTSLIEKMVLFWHNHFVTEMATVVNASFLYNYVQVLRNSALGNIKQLISEITICPAMLVYLNGESNKATAPNENYGRELFELFAIGKGPLVSSGNYTNYTEADIREAAKVLTGWRIDRTLNKSYFDTTGHDKTTKIFSDAFMKAAIPNKEASEYKDLIELIFNQKETAKYLVRKLYRWFMYAEIDQNIEDNIIIPLAATLYSNNYDIKPVLAQLLSSEHFFSLDYQGALIKNPLDFAVGIFRKSEINLSTNILNNYEIWSSVYYACQTMEMTLGDPPDVAGWPEYYKEPSYSELWINASTIPQRTIFSDTLCLTGVTKGGFKYFVDPFALTSKIDDPSKADNLLNGLALILLPVPLSPLQLAQLKEILIPGLPDSTWAFEWLKYIGAPSDVIQKGLVGKKLQAVIAQIMRLPEFYLS